MEGLNDRQNAGASKKNSITMPKISLKLKCLLGAGLMLIFLGVFLFISFVSESARVFFLFPVMFSLIGLVMLYPRISHRIFLLLSKRKKPAETAEAAMKRICRLYRIDSGCTSQEAAAVTAAKCGADISRLARLFDKAVYGEEELNSDEKEVIMEEYVQAYSLYVENNRIFRRKPAVNS